MKRLFISLIAAAALSGGGLSGGAAFAESNKVAAEMGRGLAERFCTKCHLIGPGQTDPADHIGGPTFQSVADRAGVSKASLVDHLRTTHTNALIPLSMPNPNLTDDEITKLARYILSLRKPK